jgi:hypothetical protein
VLAARNEETLREMGSEISAGGGAAIYIMADVGKRI